MVKYSDFAISKVAMFDYFISRCCIKRYYTPFYRTWVSLRKRYPLRGWRRYLIIVPIRYKSAKI